MCNQRFGRVSRCCSMRARLVMEVVMQVRRWKRVLKPARGCGMAQALVAGGTVWRQA